MLKSISNAANDFMSWSSFEGARKQPPPQPQTFWNRAWNNLGLGNAKQSLVNAADKIRDNAMAAAEKTRDTTSAAVDKVKETVGEIHFRPQAVPKWATMLGLGFWYAPGVASTLLNCAIITGFVQAIGWAIHAGTDIVAHHESFGILNIVGLALYSYAIQPAIGLRQLLLTACVTIWGLRLSAFLMDRFKDEGADRALAKVRTARGRVLLWALQAVWVFVTCLPVMIANAEGGKVTYWGPPMSFKSLNVRDFIGFGMWAIGFAYETIADWEKAQFRKKPLQEGEKPFISSGLWKFSRHPNYFGEILMWAGLYLASSPVLHGWEQISVLSPLLMAFVLRFVSGVPRVEAQADRAFGGNPSYQEYKKRTPLIVPFL